MASLTTLDIIVLLLVGGGAIFGALRGFVSEVFGLAAWIVAIVALKLFYDPVAAIVAGYVSTPTGVAILTFALIFGGVFIGTRLLAGSLGVSFSRAVLGPLDRVLGFGFGALKGLVVATIGYLLLNLANATLFGGDSAPPAWLTESRSHTLLEASSRAIVDFVEERRKKSDANPGPDEAAST